MNNEIGKFYLDGIGPEEFTEDFIREALATGIRCDNVDLVRMAAGKGFLHGSFYGYCSPMEFAIKEMASAEVIKALAEAGYELSKPCHDLTPFDGSPQKLAELWMETTGKTKEEVLQILAVDISYFFHVIKTDCSCYRIPYDVDSEDKYKPSFWNYLDEWLSEFIRFLADEGKSEIMDSCFCRCTIENVELKGAFVTLFELLGQTFSNEDLRWFINIAVSCDNEYAFEKLVGHCPSLKKEIDFYPSSSKRILSAIFDAGLLAPGTDEGFKAFIHRIAFGEIDKEFLAAIVHPSYATRTAEKGKTSLMYAIENEDFPVELYKLLIASSDDVNMQDEDGRTALHYMAKTDYPECLEKLMELGADPFITDYKENNVLHILAGNKEGLSINILGDCISLFPKKLLTMENNKGMTPLALFFQRLTGTEKVPYKKRPFTYFLEQHLASPEALDGNILIDGSVKET